MCGRYIFISRDDEIRELLYLASFGSGVELGPDDLPDGDITPGMRMPVITGIRENSPENVKAEIRAEMAVWGIPLSGGKNLVINSRRERIMSSPLFSKLLGAGRCAVPASGYYEWSREYEDDEASRDVQISFFGPAPSAPARRKKISRKYLFSMPAQKIIYMAGVFGEFDGETRYSIITGDAVGKAASIHGRMPLILTKENMSRWLNDEDSVPDILSGPIPEPEYRLAV